MKSCTERERAEKHLPEFLKKYILKKRCSHGFHVDGQVRILEGDSSSSPSVRRLATRGPGGHGAVVAGAMMVLSCGRLEA